MVWQAGRVSAVGPGAVRVRFDQLQQCQRCLRGEGCGAGVFSRLFSARGAELVVSGEHELVQGQPVRVGVQERELLISALVLYGLPVVVFILAAAAAASLDVSPMASDGIALVVGVTAALLSVRAAIRLRGRILNPRVEPLSADSKCDVLESASE